VKDITIIDHQCRTPSGCHFSCHVGDGDEEDEPYVQIGNEHLRVSDLLDIVDHIQECDLLKPKP
jgi:hypothetical protein